MLELPESTTVARQIAETFEGRKVAFVEAAHTPHGFAFYSHDADAYPNLLVGKTLDTCEAAGGIVDVTVGDVHLAFNDGTNVRFVEAGGALPKKYQFYLRFDDGGGIVCSVQMYGGMMLYENGVTDNFYYNVARTLPSPLTDAFDKPYFDALVAKADPKLSAKALLATEQRIPGLGNGVLQDILFNAGVHPQKKLRDMDRSNIDALFASVKTTLAAMTAQGGRDTDKDFFGKPGGYATILSAKTKERPCPHCGGPITRKAFLGGNVYFCPVCQPL
ncbi:zinc finger domain-containing protein [Raoultibacter phocaeensis]|uniref:zinc finger domain-containing protein n=1 Tax=Raoultibacter phocaeensis TaxID=2479841 RepID=UPI0011193806|nr:zinc finger domain-containing protein [Raoultibacter phocaeensis]